MTENKKSSKGGRPAAEAAPRSGGKGGITVAAKKKPVKRAEKASGKKKTNEVVIRDSFTMPQDDYLRLEELKQICLKAGVQVKKSELLRAGLQVLAKLSVEQLKKTISQMERIKTGRPKKA